MTLLIQGSASLIASSMRSGGTFSPPAVMRISLILPVIFKYPLSSMQPISPVKECNDMKIVTSSLLKIKNRSYHVKTSRI